jgi:superfamily II DNA helicase RecQ
VGRVGRRYQNGKKGIAVALQYQILSIPLVNPGEETEKLNHFLRAHRVVSVQKEITKTADASYCTFIVEYLHEGEVTDDQAKGTKLDYKEVLTPEDFAIFARLREARKAIGKDKGLPVYAVCTNEQLAAMARGRPGTLADLKKIPGIGEGKGSLVEALFLPILRGEALP